MTDSGPGRAGGSSLGSQGAGDPLLRFAHEGLEVALTSEALRVDLVDVLGAGRPGREPSAGGDHLEAADGCVVAGGAGELGGDRLAGQGRGLDVLRRELREARLLLGS